MITIKGMVLLASLSRVPPDGTVFIPILLVDDQGIGRGEDDYFQDYLNEDVEDQDRNVRGRQLLILTDEDRDGDGE